MNNEWLSFLISQSARIGPGGEVEFPGAPAQADCALVDLSHLGLIAVRGADGASFLQGQLTNDIREVSGEHSQISSYCSPKGRMLACLRVLRRGEDYLLLIPRDLLEPFLQRLRLFILRARVTLEDVSDTLVQVGLAGDCAEALLQQSFPVLPALANNAVHLGRLGLIRMPGSTPRFLLLGPAEAVAALWSRLSPPAVPVGAAYWSLLEIRAGIPAIHPETVDAFIPQMTNLHLVDGVSFTKGCYTGQEVVARTQYLGRLKRRLYRAAVESPMPPRPGDPLYCQESTSGQGPGQIVDAQPSGAGRYELLAVVEIEAAEGGRVRLSADGPVLRFLPLPYPIPAEGESSQG
jgi:folate-binding protein YgfZ